MDVVGGLIILFLAATGVYRLVEWLRAARRRRQERERDAAGMEGPPVGAAAEAPGLPGQPQAQIDRARELAVTLRKDFDVADEASLGRDPRFREAEAALASTDLPVEAVLELVRDTDPFVAALGLSALARRPDIPPLWTDWAIRALRRVPSELEPYIFAALEKGASYPVIGPALTQLDEGIRWDYLARFIQRRQAAGETVDVETFRRNVPLRLAEAVESFIDRYEDELGAAFRESFEAWRRGTIDAEFLGRFARIWQRPFDSPPTLLVGRRRELVEIILDAFAQTPRRSMLLVGEHGVGKSAVARAALDRLPAHFVVFEATAAQVNAGAIYVGELEGRIKEIVEKLKGHDAVWVFPGLEAALYAGQHSRSPQGLLDALLPHIESGEVTLLAEVAPVALERLLAEHPQLASAFDAVRVRPLDEVEAIKVAHHALEHDELDVGASDQTLAESFELAQQFLPGTASPGNLLRLVGSTAAEAAEQRAREFDTTDVLAALSAASGLPLELLDPHKPLELERVRAFFEQRVLGQPEAIDCVVERISLVKAGLTDPTRPLGVFLFVGPTGTGKTEIAKALAEFLFGSPNRLVRVDMSEFQTPDSLERILSDVSVEQRGSILVSSVRKDPFSVVLLDEFEKAAPPIWTSSCRCSTTAG
jgi:hypothetical protein